MNCRRQIVKTLRRWGLRSVLCFLTMLLALWATPALGVLSQPASPVFSTPPLLLQIPGFSGGSSSSNSDATLGWITLDGRDVFQIAAPQPALAQRQQRIEQNLERIVDSYLQQDNPTANIVVRQTDNTDLPGIYINDAYLMTITEQDAKLQGTVPWVLARETEETLYQALNQAAEHRQPAYLRQQAIKAGIGLFLAIALAWALHYWRSMPIRWGMRLLGRSPHPEELSEEERHHVRDAQMRVLPIVQGLILTGALVWAAGLFPQTRSLQEALIPILKVPIVIAVVIVVAYAGVRISYAVIDRFITGLTARDGYNDPDARRLQLRTSTISSVVKNIATFVWIGVGILVGLSVAGINLGLLIASFGILGLAISLAMQNLIKGAVKGFFIILEDQYAIGDVIKVGDDAGLVETMNLRITQLRDADGRLITVPMSDITRVANYSLHWSRADLKIPVHYNADINQMLDLMRNVGRELQHDPNWQELILEEPQILGVDDFGDSSVVVRVWIKTQPLKQWDVSREFRRRFKLALKETDSTIPFPQREVWLHAPESFNIDLDGQLKTPVQAQHNGRSKSEATSKTDRQPRNVPNDSDGDHDDTAESNHET